MTKKHVFVVGLDETNLELLERADEGDELEFHAALELREMRNVNQLDIGALVAKADERIDAHPNGADAIVAFYDFPATDIAPLLCRKRGLPSPSLESVLKCEHKYWSRLEQQQVVPDHIPAFRAFDPFDEGALEQVGLVWPFWIKPIKSFRSFLAFQINDEGEFWQALAEIRQHIHMMDTPFRDVLTVSDIRADLATMKESCIAESLLSGAQCTLEGYVQDGEIVSYGIVDSVREADRSSFGRYQYPSSLPLGARDQMKWIAERVVRRIGLNSSCFNAEFFYNQTDGHAYLLEINPRISQSHGDMFEKIHGVPHHRILLDISLGRPAAPLPRKGPFDVAANFMLRSFEPGRVVRVPSERELADLCAEIPGTRVQLRVRAGQHLRELRTQDSYSFELANILLGGRNQAELLARYEQCLQALTFEIAPDPPATEAIEHV